MWYETNLTPRMFPPAPGKPAGRQFSSIEISFDTPGSSIVTP
jgi:hypothetical protein